MAFLTRVCIYMEKVEAMGLKQMGMWMNEHTSGAALREVWTLDCAALHKMCVRLYRTT